MNSRKSLYFICLLDETRAVWHTIAGLARDLCHGVRSYVKGEFKAGLRADLITYAVGRYNGALQYILQFPD